MPSSGKIPAKYNVTTEFPQLGLHAAAVSGNIGLVRYALANGQPVNSVQHGILPLHAACTSGNADVVRELLAAGADVNAPRLPRRYSNDRQTPALGVAGSTPLHFAAASGHEGIIRLLLEVGGDPLRGDKNGVTPIEVAESNGYVDAATLLRLAAAGALIADHSGDPLAGPSSGAGRDPKLQIKRSLDNLLHIRSKNHSPGIVGAPVPRRSTSPGEAPRPPHSPLPPLPLAHISENQPESDGVPSPSTASTISAPGSSIPVRSKPPTTVRKIVHRRPRSAGQQETAEYPSPSPSPSPQLTASPPPGFPPLPPVTSLPYSTSPASTAIAIPLSSIPTHRLHKLGSKYSLRNLFRKATSTHDRSNPGEVSQSPLSSPPPGITSLPGSAGLSSEELASPGEEPPSPGEERQPVSAPAQVQAYVHSHIPSYQGYTSSASTHSTRSRGSSSGSSDLLGPTTPPPPVPPLPALPGFSGTGMVPITSAGNVPAVPVPMGVVGSGVVGHQGRPRKGSEVTAPSPLATVTAWSEEGEGEHEDADGDLEVSPSLESALTGEEEEEGWRGTVRGLPPPPPSKSDVYPPIALAPAATIMSPQAATGGLELPTGEEDEMDGEKLETPVADVGGEMFAGVGIFGGVAERRGILQRSPSDPQHGKNLRFEVNGEGSDVSGASGGPGAGRSRERPRGGSLSSGGSASASLSASASVFGLTGVEPTNLDEARELVHETQRAILASFDMDASGAASGSAPGTGMTLEHQLAMYGETLAIEREFARREEKERERRQREEDRQRRRLEKELGFGGRRGSEGSVGLGLGFSLGSVGGMGKGSTVLLSYDPPPWLLDDIAARRAAQGLEGGEATPPTPPEDGRPAENGNRSATANGQADGTNRLSPPAHQYRHRPPALSLSSSGSSTRPRRPPHRRAMSSSSRSGSGYGSVMEEPEDYPLPWGNTVRRNAYHPTSEAHSRSQSNDSNGLNTSGPEIVHTGPTPVSSPGTATSTQPNSASTESSTKTETHGNYAHRIWDTPPYSSIPTGLYDRDKPLSEVRGLVESPSEMTLVARKLSKTPPAGQEFTPEGTVSPQSDTGPGRRFGGLGIRGFVQTLTGR